MPPPPEPPPAPESLTTSQRARRDRVITAAFHLVREGGYDEVQMRDVAERADGALGTVYRYFSCKDHLLAAALSEWAGHLEAQVSRQPLSGDTMSERLIDALRRGTRPFQRNPHMARVLMITGGSTDPFTSETYGSFSKGVARVMGGALEGLDPDESARILRVVKAV